MRLIDADALLEKLENIDSEGGYDVESINYLITNAPTIQRDGWQPIETAPKDGKNYLFYRKGIINTARWKGDTWGGDGWSYELATNIANGFTSNLPTHWQPLPAAPTDKE